MEVAPCSKRYHRETSARWYAESVFLRYLSSAAFVLAFGKLHIATCTLMECTLHNCSCIAFDLRRALHTHWIRRHLLTNDLNLLAGVEFGAIGGFCQRWATTQCPYTVRGGISKTATGLHQSWPPETAHMSSTCWVGVFRIRLSMFDVSIPNSCWNWKVNLIGYHFPWLLNDVDALIYIKSWVSLFVVLRVTLTERFPRKKAKQKSLGVTWPLTHATFLFRKI